MTDHEVEVSVYDGCLFYKNKDGVIHGMICCHVDDFLWAGTSEFKDDIIEAKFDECVIGSNDKGSFKYLGVSIFKEGGDVMVSLSRYTEELEKNGNWSEGSRALVDGIDAVITMRDQLLEITGRQLGILRYIDNKYWLIHYYRWKTLLKSASE